MTAPYGLVRAEAKVGAFETLQPKFDRRIAELSGSAGSSVLGFR